MTTIRRNWTKRVTAVRDAARYCRAYDSSTGHLVPVDPARAFEVWEANRRAVLIENTPGAKWTVHVHSNSFYVLTTEEPTPPRRPAAPAPVRPATASTPARRTAPSPARTAAEERVLGDVREYIQDAPGIGANAAAAATSAIGAKVEAGRIKRDGLTGTLPALTAAITAKAVRDMRGQGLTHDQIRMRLERKRAEAQHAGNHGRVTVADAMLAAHAGIVADERARATGDQLTAGDRRALPAGEADHQA
ncbi:hypothetical protein ACFYNV_29020 [Streptomyces albidoflavus]